MLTAFVAVYSVMFVLFVWMLLHYRPKYHFSTFEILSVSFFWWFWLISAVFSKEEGA